MRTRVLKRCRDRRGLWYQAHVFAGRTECFRCGAAIAEKSIANRRWRARQKEKQNVR